MINADPLLTAYVITILTILITYYTNRNNGDPDATA